MSITTSDGGGTVSLNLNSSDVILNINDPGGSMASRSGPVTININIDDASANQLLGLLGPGLIAVEEQSPFFIKQVEVALGEGLAFTSDNHITIPVGTGLSISPENNLLVNLGQGLVVNEQNEVTTVGSQESIIGQGLVIDPTTTLIDVNVGEGLAINTQNEVTLNLGTGLAFDGTGAVIATGVVPGIGPGLMIGEDGDIEVNVGAGLGFDENGALTSTAALPGLGDGLILGVDGDIELNVGAGLDIDDNGILNVDVGTGLTIDANGRLAVDNTTLGVNGTFKVLTDTQFSFKDSVLYIAKVFTTYNVVHSNTGAVINITVASTSVETDTVSFSNGYGMSFGAVVPNRTPDPKKPSFYKS
jgi:hypothetical protein